jgi:hypothetical protein
VNLDNHRRTFVDGCELLDGWPQVRWRPGNDTGRNPPLHLRHGDHLLRRSSDMGLHSGPSSVAAATIAPCHCRHRASKSSAHLARHNTSLNCTRGRAPQPTQETSLKELTPLPASFNLPWPFPQTHARAHETTLLLLARCAQCVDEIAPLWRWPEERVVLCGGLFFT